MKRVYALILGGLAFTGVVTTVLVAVTRESPAAVDGYWVGSMTLSGKTVDIAVQFDRAAGSFSSKGLMVLDAPISNVQAYKDKVAFTWASDGALRFEGARQGPTLAGTVAIPGLPPDLPVTFAMVRQSDAPPPKAYQIESVTVESAGARLSAQIYVPGTRGPRPALVLLHGSAPSPKQAYSYDAGFFAGLGFEVLIFDKRGTGASTGNYRRATYDDLATDAAACLETMRRRAGVTPGRIGLWGFSQGAMLLPLVLTKTAIPSFLIAKSPEIEGATEAAAYADRARVARAGYPAANGQIVVDTHRRVREMIRAGRDRRAVQDFIRQNAQQHPFMNQTGLYGNLAIDPDEFEGLYWKGRTQDFRPLWEGVRIPTLVLFGADDEYIDPVKNMSLLAGFNRARLTTKLFLRANHSLKKAFDPAKYADIDWPRRIDGSEEFVAEWIRQNVLAESTR